MRALVGAIITAASLIAIGLTSMGIGLRYQLVRLDDNVSYHRMDHTFLSLIGLEVVLLLIGLATTFVGLMYHHHRRYHEHLLSTGQHPHHATSPRVTVP